MTIFHFECTVSDVSNLVRVRCGECRMMCDSTRFPSSRKYVHIFKHEIAYFSIASYRKTSHSVFYQFQFHWLSSPISLSVSGACFVCLYIYNSSVDFTISKLNDIGSVYRARANRTVVRCVAHCMHIDIWQLCTDWIKYYVVKWNRIELEWNTSAIMMQKNERNYGINDESRADVFVGCQVCERVFSLCAFEWSQDYIDILCNNTRTQTHIVWNALQIIRSKKEINTEWITVNAKKMVVTCLNGRIFTQCYHPQCSSNIKNYSHNCWRDSIY